MQLSRVPNSPLSTVGTSAFRNETFIYPSPGNMNACPPFPESNYCSDNSEQGFSRSKIQRKRMSSWT